MEVNGVPLIKDVFDNLIDSGANEFIIVVGYKTEQIIDRYGDQYRDVPITYTYQREQLGLAHAALQAEPHIDGDFSSCSEIMCSVAILRTLLAPSESTAPTQCFLSNKYLTRRRPIMASSILMSTVKLSKS